MERITIYNDDLINNARNNDHPAEFLFKRVPSNYEKQVYTPIKTYDHSINRNTNYSSNFLGYSLNSVNEIVGISKKNKKQLFLIPGQIIFTHKENLEDPMISDVPIQFYHEIKHDNNVDKSIHIFFIEPKHIFHLSATCPYCSPANTILSGTRTWIGQEGVRNLLQWIFQMPFDGSKPDWLVYNPKNALKFNIDPFDLKSEVSPFPQRLTLDGYQENLKIAFEFDGIQHFEINKNIVKNDNWEKLRARFFKDLEKDRICKENSVTLIRISNHKKIPIISEVEETYINLPVPIRDVPIKNGLYDFSKVPEILLNELIKNKRYDILKDYRAKIEEFIHKDLKQKQQIVSVSQSFNFANFISAPNLDNHISQFIAESHIMPYNRSISNKLNPFKFRIEFVNFCLLISSNFLKSRLWANKSLSDLYELFDITISSFYPQFEYTPKLKDKKVKISIPFLDRDVLHKIFDKMDPKSNFIIVNSSSGFHEKNYYITILNKIKSYWNKLTFYSEISYDLNISYKKLIAELNIDYTQFPVDINEDTHFLIPLLNRFLINKIGLVEIEFMQKKNAARITNLFLSKEINLQLFNYEFKNFEEKMKKLVYINKYLRNNILVLNDNLRNPDYSSLFILCWNFFMEERYDSFNDYVQIIKPKYNFNQINSFINRLKIDLLHFAMQVEYFPLKIFESLGYKENGVFYNNLGKIYNIESKSVKDLENIKFITKDQNIYHMHLSDFFRHQIENSKSSNSTQRRLSILKESERRVTIDNKQIDLFEIFQKIFEDNHNKSIDGFSLLNAVCNRIMSNITDLDAIDKFYSRLFTRGFKVIVRIILKTHDLMYNR
jgi:hypothetical protein